MLQRFTFSSWALRALGIHGWADAVGTDPADIESAHVTLADVDPDEDGDSIDDTSDDGDAAARSRTNGSVPAVVTDHDFDRATLIDALDTAQTVHQVARELGLDRGEATTVLDALGVADEFQRGGAQFDRTDAERVLSGP